MNRKVSSKGDNKEAVDAYVLKQSRHQIFHTLEPVLVPLFAQLQATIVAHNTDQGFWESDNTGEKIALMHSELSEALEADRKNITSDDKIPDFTGVEAELADTIIRIFDFAGFHQLRLAEALVAKMHVNLERPFKHGKAY